MEIKQAEYLISSPSIEKCPPPDKAEFAFIGRSNVGKSSLINMLTGNSKLAKTSASPGKTQMINHFIINKNWYLVDLPGYGYAKVSQQQRKKWAMMIEHYLVERRNLMTTFVLLDSRHPPQHIDLEFLQQLHEWQVPMSLVFTKADKTTQKSAQQNARLMKDMLRVHWPYIPQTFITSSVKQLAKREMLNYIAEQIILFNQKK